jgi:TolB-like protein/Flp pilus assembly protein TadD
VSIDTLMSQVWSGLVVNPETVSQRIKLLRDAIGDDSRAPRYIASVRGRGYKLLLEVAPVPADPAAAPAPTATGGNAVAPAMMIAPPLQTLTTEDEVIASAGPRRKRVLLILAGLAAAAAAIAWLLTDRLWLSRRSPASPGPTMVGAPSPSSIAVLPFVDMSAKKDQEYFSDGLTEELIDRLTKVPELHVPARTSSFYFKGRQATITDIAHALAVTHVLEGSVRTSGNELRITAQLIRVDTGYHIWSETYDRRLDDIFQIQDEISAAVVKQLKTSLLSTRVARLAPTQNAEAYTLYLQAKSIFQRSGKPDYDQAIALLYRAVALDPSFATAWSEIAWIRIRQYRMGFIPLDRASRDAHAAIDTAIALAPALAEARLNHGRVLYVLDWKWGEAEAELKRTMELDPGTADLYQWTGLLARTLGNFDAAMQLFEEQAARDPLSPHAYDLMGELDMQMGRWSEAERNLARAHALMPLMYGDTYRAKIELLRQRPKQALAALGDAAGPEIHFYRSWAFQLLGSRAESDRELEALERGAGDDLPLHMAQLHALRGETDETFRWLDHAYELHDLDLVVIKGDNLLASVRGDPRFAAFLAKMGLPR